MPRLPSILLVGSVPSGLAFAGTFPPTTMLWMIPT
jgi:hypothetical protein